MAGGCAWQGVMHGRGAVHGRVCVWQGCAWWGACTAGGMRGRRACVTGETAIAAGGTHPTGMHSCSVENQTNKKVAVFQNSKSGVYARLWERKQRGKSVSFD